MSLELWSAVASTATFAVLATTAIVAVIQLHHIRGSNQVTALNEFREALESPQYRAAVIVALDLAKRINDPVVRRDLEADTFPEWLQPMAYLLRLFETLGTYVKQGIVSQRIVFDLWQSPFVDNWERLAPAIVVMRRKEGPAFMENFEMLACLAARWKQRNPTRYPKHLPRIAPQDRWLEEDRAAGETQGSP
jgi:hypothetical protein